MDLFPVIVTTSALLLTIGAFVAVAAYLHGALQKWVQSLPSASLAEAVE